MIAERERQKLELGFGCCWGGGSGVVVRAVYSVVNRGRVPILAKREVAFKYKTSKDKTHSLPFFENCKALAESICHHMKNKVWEQMIPYSLGCFWKSDLGSFGRTVRLAQVGQCLTLDTRRTVQEMNDGGAATSVQTTSQFPSPDAGHVPATLWQNKICASNCASIREGKEPDAMQPPPAIYCSIRCRKSGLRRARITEIGTADAPRLERREAGCQMQCSGTESSEGHGCIL